MKRYILDYAPPTPPAGTGPHRYEIILLKQNIDKPYSIPVPQSRARFNRVSFIQEHKLQLVAKALFRTEHD